MIKKLLPLLAAALALALILCGCAGSGETPPDGESGKLVITEDGSNNSLDALTGAFDYGALLEENGYFKGVKALDYVTVPDDLGSAVPDSVLTASDEAIQEQIDYMLEQSASHMQIMDASQKIKDGDTVNIDYVGSVDGVEFAGGSTGGRGTTVTIGVTSYIDDFLEQLIGHAPGENFDIEVTFPDPYLNNPDLAGKDAVFNITINYIEGPAILPTFNDTFAQGYGYDSADVMRGEIADWLVDQQKQDYFTDVLNDMAVSDVPAVVTEYISGSIIAEYTSYAKQQGVSLDELMDAYGYDGVTGFLAEIEDQMTAAAHRYLAVQAIAEREGITVSDEYVTQNVPESDLDNYGMKYMKQYHLRDLVQEFFYTGAQ